jgi:hypothetical protein
MDLIDELKTLSSKVAKQKDSIQTEEATKNAFVMPLIAALGYNVFDPDEVTPELTADIGTKKGEKVDYAILKENKPIILFECKWCGVNLDKQHKSQLYRYFSVTEARFGVLTNGIIFRFYTDLEEPNKMDSKPFMEFNLLNVTEQAVEDLKKFSKSFFNVDETLTVASELKYTKEIKRILAEQLLEPTDDFVKLFASQIYSGKVTQNVRQQFTDLVRRALHQFINEKINERLKFALLTEDSLPSSESALLESLQREELGAIEEAKTYQALLDKGNTAEELAKKLGLKQAWRITERTNLLNLKPEYQAMLGEGLSNSQATEMGRLPKDKQDVLFKRIQSGEADTNNKLKEHVNELLASAEQKQSREERIVTTEDEIKGHKIVQEILKPVIEPERVALRDTISYCGILFDDNNRKPICRLYFNNPKRKQLALLDKNKNEEKVPINELTEIHQHAERLIEIVNYYLSI